MAKLKKTTSKKPNRPVDPNATPRQSNPTLLIGILLAVAVGILFWVLTSQLQEKGRVMIAKNNVPAFSTLSNAQLQPQTVPQDSITESDLTEEKYKELTGKGSALVNRIELLAGQRVNIGAVTASQSGSLSAVKPGERVIAVNATFPGVVAGLATSGSVVDVYAGAGSGNNQDGGEAVADNAKVLALGAGAAAASNVKPNKQLSEAQDAGGGIIVVLAVPIEDAPRILALSQASLALDPRYSFTENGTICQINRCAQLNQSQTGGGSAAPVETPDETAAPDQPSEDAPQADQPADQPADQLPAPDQPAEGQ